MFNSQFRDVEGSYPSRERVFQFFNQFVITLRIQKQFALFCRSNFKNFNWEFSNNLSLTKKGRIKVRNASTFIVGIILKNILDKIVLFLLLFLFWNQLQLGKKR